MGVNLLGAVLVAFSGSGPRPVPPPSTPESTYAVDYTSYLVDLSRWTETTHGPVVITRTDYVRKLSNKSEDYTIPYFTIGQSIECKPLTYSSKPQFIKKDEPDRKGAHYDYVLPIGHQPAGHSEMVSSQFVYPTGFSNKDKEWWESRVAYPTNTISAVFRFPSEKPAKNMAVSRKRGDERGQPINDNLPSLSDEGRIAHWVGINEGGNARIHFDWEW